MSNILQQLAQLFTGPTPGPDAIPRDRQPSMRDRMKQNALAGIKRSTQRARGDGRLMPLPPPSPSVVGGSYKGLPSGEAETLMGGPIALAAAAGLVPSHRRGPKMERSSPDAIAKASVRKPVSETDVRAVPSKSAGKAPIKRRRTSSASRLAALLASVPETTPGLPPELMPPQGEAFNPNVYKGLFAPPLSASSDLSGMSGLAPAVDGQMPDLDQKRNILKRMLGIGA